MSSIVEINEIENLNFDKIYKTAICTRQEIFNGKTFRSLGFLIKNQLNTLDTNVYIVFPYHSFPNYSDINDKDVNNSNVSFFVEDGLKDGVLYNVILTFRIIGFDVFNDLVVGVYLPDLDDNKGISLVNHVVLTLEPDFTSLITPSTGKIDPNNKFNYFVNKFDTVKNAISVNISDYNFKGPTDMTSFYYPLSVMLNCQPIGGESGSPLIKNNKAYAMISHSISVNSETEYDPNLTEYSKNINDNNVIGISCKPLYYLIFKKIIPDYLYQINFVSNSIEVLNVFISNGIKRNFLGLLGNYVNSIYVNQRPELRILKRDGFVVSGFASTYFIRQFKFETRIISKLNNLDFNKIKVFTPFNPSNNVVAPLYDNFFTAPSLVIHRIKFINIDNLEITIDLGLEKDSLSEYIIFANPIKPFKATYSYFNYLTSTWILVTDEEIVPNVENYSLNDFSYTQYNSEFPYFLNGLEMIFFYNRKFNGDYYVINYLS